MATAVSGSRREIEMEYLIPVLPAHPSLLPICSCSCRWIRTPLLSSSPAATGIRCCLLTLSQSVRVLWRYLSGRPVGTIISSNDSSIRRQGAARHEAQLLLAGQARHRCRLRGRGQRLRREQDRAPRLRARRGPQRRRRDSSDQPAPCGDTHLLLLHRVSWQVGHETRLLWGSGCVTCGRLKVPSEGCRRCGLFLFFCLTSCYQDILLQADCDAAKFCQLHE